MDFHITAETVPWQQAVQAQGAERHAHHIAVAVFDAADDLLEEVPRLVLQKATLLDDVVKQLARLPCIGFSCWR